VHRFFPAEKILARPVSSRARDLWNNNLQFLEQF